MDGGGDDTGDTTRDVTAAAAAAAPTVRVAGLVGVVAPFNGKEEEWIDYAERLEHYFIANDITDVAKKRAIFAQCSGSIYLSFDQNSGTARSPERLHL